jgi:hypothetical protein
MSNFLKESQLLRNKLIFWRFKNYYRIKKEATRFEDPKLAEDVFGKNSKISSRIKQIVLPLWLIGGEECGRVSKSLRCALMKN